ncbi:hypothetical protein [Moraxella bovis]|uniref:hypothetical protein n=1 Tax=Moraxella bovis TaxID=476 RepID=UPI001301369B|nr:hypothetical protein [Moraxella bovis]UYZ81657.1 hypothetical protein LP113_02615 [Moraxella bovis]UYZ89061.1 hypothetical protein LP114_11680 [Moraxella bovis]UYZ95847.1 hypothetical protein LP121_04615 [Moraxella bovis]UZA08003.1 hypothetical protein LP108_09205 [Moraxella bovis]UZA17153.1 hypothetical protein LP109_02135 [Moraxella bovis]
MAGVGLGLIGVGQYQGGFSLIGMFPVLGVAFSWAIGNVIVKKKSDKSIPYHSSFGATHHLYARLARGVWRGRCDKPFGKF